MNIAGSKWLTFATTTSMVAVGGPILSFLAWILIFRRVNFFLFMGTCMGLLFMAVASTFLEGPISKLIGWGKSAIRIAWVTVAIGVLYFSASQTFHIYVWGHELPLPNLQRLLLLAMVALASIVVIKGRTASAFSKIALTVIVLAFVFRAVLPHWNATWTPKTEAIDKSFAAKGVMPTIAAMVPSAPQALRSASNTAAEPPFSPQPSTTAGSFSGQDTPSRVVVRLGDSFERVVNLPKSFNSGYCFVARSDDGRAPNADWEFSIQFVKWENGGWSLDGPPLGPFKSFDDPYFPHRPLTFMVKGRGEMVFFPGDKAACDSTS